MSEGEDPPPRWQELDDMENVQWLELLRPFTTTKNLYLSEETALRVAPALQELTGGKSNRSVARAAKSLLRGFSVIQLRSLHDVHRCASSF